MASVLILGCAPTKALLRLPRPLTAAEMDTVVSGIRQALAGKTLRLLGQHTGEPEILIGRDGFPRIVRVKGQGERIASITSETGTLRVFNLPDVIVWLREYSRVPARRCNGRSAASGMVTEYLLNLTTKVRNVTAREPGRRDLEMVRPFQMLEGAATLTSGGSRLIGKRSARALVAPMPMSDGVVLTGDPAPNPKAFVPMQSLWIDAESLLPLRWEVSQRQAMIVGGVDFVYEPLELKRPSGFEVPTCIP